VSRGWWRALVVQCAMDEARYLGGSSAWMIEVFVFRLEVCHISKSFDRLSDIRRV